MSLQINRFLFLSTSINYIRPYYVIDISGRYTVRCNRADIAVKVSSTELYKKIIWKGLLRRAALAIVCERK